jgi:hypothetical protein
MVPAGIIEAPGYPHEQCPRATTNPTSGMSAEVVLVSVTVNLSASPPGRSGAGSAAATVASIPATGPVAAGGVGSGAVAEVTAVAAVDAEDADDVAAVDAGGTDDGADEDVAVDAGAETDTDVDAEGTDDVVARSAQPASETAPAATDETTSRRSQTSMTVLHPDRRNKPEVYSVSAPGRPTDLWVS